MLLFFVADYGSILQGFCGAYDYFGFAVYDAFFDGGIFVVFVQDVYVDKLGGQLGAQDSGFLF